MAEQSGSTRKGHIGADVPAIRETPRGRQGSGIRPGASNMRGAQSQDTAHSQSRGAGHRDKRWSLMGGGCG